MEQLNGNRSFSLLSYIMREEGEEEDLNIWTLKAIKSITEE